MLTHFYLYVLILISNIQSIIGSFVAKKMYRDIDLLRPYFVLAPRKQPPLVPAKAVKEKR